MDGNTSSLATFHSLGTRRDILFTQSSRANSFIYALDSIKVLLADAGAQSRPTSVPQLIRAIYDDSQRTTALEQIREVIRPNHSLGFHDISATGTKLLACLAITQDPLCLDHNGHLKVDYTKSVIRGWFDNGDTLSLDDSALRNIRAEANPTQGARNILILGRNRLTHVPLLNAGDIAMQMKTNHSVAGLGETSLTIDLNAVPTKSINVAFAEATVGDMNGNSLMFLHELVGLGFAEIAEGKQDQWQQLATKIKNNDVTNFGTLLTDLLVFNKTDKKLVLLGDLLSDRAFNDWFTLEIIDVLRQQGQDFDIIFSNHDAAFVEYYLANKDKTSDQAYSAAPDNLSHAVRPNTSLIRLNNLLNQEPTRRAEFHRLAQTYLSRVSIVGCSQDQATVYSHGVLNENMMADMLTLAGVNPAEQGNLGLQEKVLTINAYFRANAFKNVDAFREVMRGPDADNPDMPDTGRHPFFFAIWNKGPFSDSKHVGKVAGHPYCNADLPLGAARAVHGHTDDMAMRFEEDTKRLKAYQQIADVVAADPAGDLRTWIARLLPCLIDAESGTDASAVLGQIFVLYLNRVSSAYVDASSPLGQAIRQFFASCDSYPSSPVVWFQRYESDDPNDIVMKEKRRQNPAHPENATYIKISTTDGTLDKIGQAHARAKQAHMQPLVQTLKTIFSELNRAAGLAIDQPPDRALANFALASVNEKSRVEVMLKKKQGTSVQDARAVDIHATLIADVVQQAIATENEGMKRAGTLAAAEGMKRYRSLDASFGASENDALGTLPVILG